VNQGAKGGARQAENHNGLLEELRPDGIEFLFPY